MTTSQNSLASLGFGWNRSALPAVMMRANVDRACARFIERIPVFVWDAGALEGNPITLPEVRVLLAGGSVAHRKITEQEQILNLAESSRRLLALVKAGEFKLSKSVFTELNGIVARNEALE